MRGREDLLQPDGGWRTASSVRITPPPPSARSLLFRAVSRASAAFGREDVPDIFVVMSVHGRLFWAWLFFASRLMPFGRLDARDRELAILRTGWRCRCRYEWGQHVDLALRVGVSVEDVANVAVGPEAFSEPRLRALLRACDELCADDAVGDETWMELARFYDARLLVEITMLVGHYRMIAGFLNSSGIALEEALEARLDAFHEELSVIRDRDRARSPRR